MYSKVYMYSYLDKSKFFSVKHWDYLGSIALSIYHHFSRFIEPSYYTVLCSLYQTILINSLKNLQFTYCFHTSIHSFWPVGSEAIFGMLVSIEKCKPIMTLWCFFLIAFNTFPSFWSAGHVIIPGTIESRALHWPAGGCVQCGGMHFITQREGGGIS